SAGIIFTEYAPPPRPRKRIRSCLLSHTPPLVEPDSNEVDMENGPALVLSDEAPAGTSPASKARDTTRIATTLAELGQSVVSSGTAGREERITAARPRTRHSKRDSLISSRGMSFASANSSMLNI